MTESNYEESVRFTVPHENGTNRYPCKRYNVNPIPGRRRNRLLDLDIPKPCILLTFILLLISLLLLGLLPLFILDCNNKGANTAEKQESLKLNGGMLNAGIIGSSESDEKEYLEATTNILDNLTTTDVVLITEYNPKHDYRLPENLKPQIYTIRLLVFPDNATIKGQVNVHFDCILSTNKIILNSKNLFINQSTIILKHSQNKNDIKILSIDYNGEEEKVTLIVDSMLENNANYELTIAYEGIINDFPKGIYRSSYIDSTSGLKTWVVNTLFSPTEARSAFPCFDEPDFKARFNFIIGRPAGFISISNMNIKISEPIQGGYVLDYYFETPTMSTYLTAFLVGEFKPYSAVKSSSIRINSFARDGGLESMKYATELAPKIVAFFENYFDLKFPLPKIDLIAVPNQFYSAMENWGAIIFKENKIFVTNTSTDGKRQSVALLLAHEIAHQWFGNLVTPKWWSDLWLKEGFSTYFGYIAIDYLIPEWNIINRFSIDEMDLALSSDSLNSTEPISKVVKKTRNDLFSIIQYHKGTSIIWMMSNLLGEATSKSWVSKYLKEFSFKNADQNDLWDSITEQSHKFSSLPSNYSIKTIMDSWTTQPGYPVVTMQRDYNSSKIYIHQKRFLFNDKDSESQSLWWIPISFSGVESESMVNIWLSEKTAVFNTTYLSLEEPYIGNINKTGYYRVNYDHENWVRLINIFSDLSPVTKGQLLVDSFALAEYGTIKYDIPLSMAAQLGREKNDFVWRSVKNSLYYIHNSLILTPAFGNYQVFVTALLPTVYYSVNPSNSTTWINTKTALKDEDHVTNILEIACKFEYDICVTNSIHLFNLFMNSNGEDLIPISLRPIIYCTALKHLGRREWDFIYSLRTKPTTSKYLTNEESAVLVRSLGCSSKPWLLTRALGLILQPNSGLTKEEGIQLFKSVAENHIGLRIALSFLRSMSSKLINHYRGPSIIYEMVQSIIPFLNTPDDISELKLIMNNIANITNEHELIRKQCLERAQNNVKWMQINFGFVAYFLEQFRQYHGL